MEILDLIVLSPRTYSLKGNNPFRS